MIHDFLYGAWQFLKDEKQRKPRRKDKTFADLLYYELLLLCGVDQQLAETMRWAVSMCGWSAYKDENVNTWCTEDY